MSIEKGSESNIDSTVFHVTGEASVERDATGNTAEAARWSCFSQYRSDDPTKVYASIRDIHSR